MFASQKLNCYRSWMLNLKIQNKKSYLLGIHLTSNRTSLNPLLINFFRFIQFSFIHGYRFIYRFFLGGFFPSIGVSHHGVFYQLCLGVFYQRLDFEISVFTKDLISIISWNIMLSTNLSCKIWNLCLLFCFRTLFLWLWTPGSEHLLFVVWNIQVCFYHRFWQF